MVTIEGLRSPEAIPKMQATLEHHWMLDPTTANELARALPPEGTEHIHSLLDGIEQQSAEAIQQRDVNRLEVQKIFSGESDKQLVILGPCSLDAETDYTELFDYLEDLQDNNPNLVVGVRLNGAKPRSSGGNTGPFSTTKPGGRRKQLDANEDAFARGIPIFTEVTDKDQYAQLGPYLTGAWIGARDMASTDLRTFFSATRLNVLIKNATDGKLSSIKDGITALRKNTEQNDGSGVNLGHLASTCRHEDGGPAIFTVGKGNPNVAIIARGYELQEEEYDGKKITLVHKLNEQQRQAKAIEHLSKMCMLAADIDCVAVLDGSHKVPEMLDMKKTVGNRFLKVLRSFNETARQGKINNLERLVGFLGEVSVNIGITDKNLVLNKRNKKSIANEIREFKDLGKAKHVNNSLEVKPKRSPHGSFVPN